MGLTQPYLLLSQAKAHSRTQTRIKEHTFNHKHTHIHILTCTHLQYTHTQIRRLWPNICGCPLPTIRLIPKQFHTAIKQAHCLTAKGGRARKRALVCVCCVCVLMSVYVCTGRCEKMRISWAMRPVLPGRLADRMPFWIAI